MSESRYEAAFMVSLCAMISPGRQPLNHGRADSVTLESPMDPARILIVDDLPENLDILGGLLEPEGYSIETARDGQEAVEKALASPPDLILMDVSMPRLTGFEACRRLKADERTQ